MKATYPRQNFIAICLSRRSALGGAYINPNSYTGMTTLLYRKGIKTKFDLVLAFQEPKRQDNFEQLAWR